MRNNVDEIVKTIKKKVNVEGSYIGIVLGTCFSNFIDEVQNKEELPVS